MKPLPRGQRDPSSLVVVRTLHGPQSDFSLSDFVYAVGGTAAGTVRPCMLNHERVTESKGFREALELFFQDLSCFCVVADVFLGLGAKLVEASDFGIISISGFCYVSHLVIRATA